MPQLVAFLRAINVGGHTVTMGRLRELFEGLGFENVETFIASGNVIFDTRARDQEALARKIEKHLHAGLGYEVATFLRTPAEVAAIAATKPFPAAAVAKAHTLVVGLLEKPLDAAQKKAVMAFQTPDDTFDARGREFYWLTNTGQGKSKFSNAVFEKAIRAKATFRGMPTMAKLSAKYPAGRG
jgi:uncharacterized protein (DUF1697 family)